MFDGSIVALITPFDANGEVDLCALSKLVDFHLEQGSSGIVIAGTTGESAALSQNEISSLLGHVLKQVAGRIPVIAGTGAASTRVTIELTRAAAECGADAALVVTPYYLRPPQSGLEAHFIAVADESDIPVILYNVPSRTSVDLLPSTVERLSSHTRIVGIKEAVADAGRVDELIGRCGESFAVLSGDDPSCLQAMKHGARGVISVAANIVPGRILALSSLAAQADWAQADGLNEDLGPLFDILMIETNPIPVKWALFEMGLVGPHIRLPLTRLDDNKQIQLRRCLQRLELLVS